MPLNWYSSMKKKIEKDSDNFWHRKLTLKVRNWHFSIDWFRADVDLTKKKLWKSAIFHSIKLPFDAEVDEKFLNVIYTTYRSRNNIPYARHHNCSWILTIQKDWIFWKKLLENKEMVFKNGVKNIQAAAYNGTRMVCQKGEGICGLWVLN